MPKKYNSLFNGAKGIKLDVGCGPNKQKGCIGMDIDPHPQADIVHDVQKFPWPVPDNICTFILLSHIWEHIEPKYRFRMMDELWRICRHDGQLFIACPHAGSYLEAAHPAHYMCPNEATFQFFDPDYYFWHTCGVSKPLPWRIVNCRANLGGCIEIILEPRKDRRGKAEKPPTGPMKYGAVQLIERKRVDEVKWPERRKKNNDKH